MHLAWKIVKIFVYILCGLILLIFAATFFIDPLAKRFIENEVGKAGEGQYVLQLDEVAISLLRGNILLKGIRFETDTAGAELAPVVLVEADEFSAKGVNWLTFVLERRLLIDQISLYGLNVQLKGRPTDTLKSTEPFRFHQLDIYPNIREQVSRIHLRDLALNEIDFLLINLSTNDSLQFIGSRLDLHSKDIIIDADELITKERAFYAAYIDFEGEQLQLRRRGTMHWDASVNHLNLLTREDAFGMKLNLLHFLQTENNAQDTLMLLGLQHFELRELNLHQLQEEQIAGINKISLSGLNFINGAVKSNGEIEKSPSNGQADTVGGMPARLSDLSLGKFLPDFMNILRIDTVELEAVYYKQGTVLNIDNFALQANRLELDAGPAFADKRFLHTESLQSSLSGFKYNLENAGYQFRGDSLQLEAGEGIAHLQLSRLAATRTKNAGNKMWLAGQVALLALEGIDTRNLDDGGLHIGRISTKRPHLSLTMDLAGPSGNTAESTASIPDLYPGLKGILEMLSIGKLDVMEGNLQLTDAGTSFGSLSVPNLNVQLVDILIDHESALSNDRILHSKAVGLEVSNLSYGFPDHINSLQLGMLSLSSSAKTLSLQNIEYGNKWNKKPVKDQELMLAPVAAFTTKTIDLQGVDYHGLFHGKGLKVDSLVVKGTSVELAAFADSKEPANSLESLPLSPEPIVQSEEKDQNGLLAGLKLDHYLPVFLPQVAVQSIQITELNIQEEDSLMLKNLRLQASALRLDNSSAFAQNQFLHTERLSIGFDTLWILAGDPGHYLMARDFDYNIEKGIGRLELGKVIVKPLDIPLDKSWVEAEIPGLVIPNISTRQLSQGILNLDEIIIRRPHIVVHTPSEDPGTSGKAMEEEAAAPPDVFPLVEDLIKEFRLKKLGVEEGELRLAGFGGSFYGMSLHDLNMELHDIYIARGSAFSDQRLLHTAGISGKVDKMILLFPDKVYTLQLNTIELNTPAQSLKAKDLRLEYGDNFEKVLQAPAKNDVYRLINKELLLDGLDFRAMLMDNEFRSQTVRLEGLDLYIFKDLNMPEAERIKPMPRDMVFNMGMPFYIGRLEAEDFSITYEEKAANAETAGLVAITEVATTIENITNIASELAKRPDMQLSADGRLMGRGYFETQMNIPLLDETKKLRIQGSIDTLDMSRLNRISRYNSRIAIEQGTLYKASWDFEADGDLASGDFEVSYEDLKVQLSSKNTPDTTGVLKDIGSYLVNLVVVDSSIAEEKTQEPKKVVFEEKRNKNKSFFNFYVHSLLTGLMEAIGVPFQ